MLWLQKSLLWASKNAKKNPSPLKDTQRNLRMLIKRFKLSKVLKNVQKRLSKAPAEQKEHKIVGTWYNRPLFIILWWFDSWKIIFLQEKSKKSPIWCQFDTICFTRRIIISRSSDRTSLILSDYLDSTGRRFESFHLNRKRRFRLLLKLVQILLKWKHWKVFWNKNVIICQLYGIWLDRNLIKTLEITRNFPYQLHIKFSCAES